MTQPPVEGKPGTTRWSWHDDTGKRTPFSFFGADKPAYDHDESVRQSIERIRRLAEASA